MPGKEVESKCDRELLQQQPLLTEGGRKGVGIKRFIKRLRQVGQGDRVKVVITSGSV